MRIGNVDLLNAAYVKWRFKRLLILPGRKVHLYLAPGSRGSGEGQLVLGEQWRAGLRLPSQMVMRRNSEVVVRGKFAIYCGHSIWINENATLVLGSGYINNGLNLSCFERIEIGDDVAISENVTIRDSDNHSVNGSEPTKPVKIGNKVWIGVNATILKGVTVGDGAVIAAGSLVIRDVPSRALVAGVPAGVRKTQVEWC